MTLSYGRAGKGMLHRAPPLTLTIRSMTASGAAHALSVLSFFR